MSRPAQIRRYGTPAASGATCTLAAAALFGAGAPFAKLLLRQVGPLMLSALLYLGAALGLILLRAASYRRAGKVREARLRGADFRRLATITILGGIAAPLLMLYGLKQISALAGSLLLNLEAPFTVLIAVAMFGEHLGPRELLATAIIIGGAIFLGWAPGEFHAGLVGSGSIAAACLCWAIDNNLSQRLSIRDPVAVANLKALGAGVATLAIAFALGFPTPPGGAIAAAFGLGALSYGLSLYLAMLGLRILGAAREAAYFASAPFIGALISIPLFKELPSRADWIGAALMGLGVVALMREGHSHLHAHDALFHDHSHYHDEHHRHDHAVGETPVPEPHAHPHRHGRLVHSHPHASDLHHRHPHRRGESAGGGRAGDEGRHN